MTITVAASFLTGATWQQGGKSFHDSIYPTHSNGEMEILIQKAGAETREPSLEWTIIITQILQKETLGAQAGLSTLTAWVHSSC